MHEFEQLEDEVLTKLEVLKASGLKTLEAYSGQIEAADLEEITMRFPCLYVMASGLNNKRTNKLDRCKMELTVMVGDRNVRGSSSAARGDISSPGVYGLLESAREALHRQTIIDGWTPLFLLREDPVVYMPKNGVCFYAAVYETKSLRNL